MATYTRKNAWSNGGTFSNTDLLWYAKGVGVMMKRPLNSPDSWWFFAAIHGQEIALNQFPGWGFLPAPPAVPTTPQPTAAVKKLYWDQCQHQSWYFAPWHRGYLIALEAQIRAAIKSIGGPTSWALPYWNYLGPSTQYKIPPAFTQAKLPDGTPNPLFVKARYGPKMTGSIYVVIPPVSSTCLKNTLYTGSNPLTPPPGYGGPQTGFWHGGTNPSGNLESNPHNLVHVDVGGINNTQTLWGLMTDPDIAALDPIFYIHHSNIDRMWAAWNAAGNANPATANWLKGPAASGGRKFAMPMPNGTSWVYTPDDVKSLSQLNYTYDTLPAVTPTSISTVHRRRLAKLGASPAAAAAGEDMEVGGNTELLGANEKTLKITTSGARSTVKLSSKIHKKVRRSLTITPTSAQPDQVYLELQNVRGNIDAYKLAISVNQKPAGTVGLFGLRKASEKDGKHGGGGLTFLLDITDVVDDLFVDDDFDLNSLDVRVVPNQAVPSGADLTIGRISVYRQGQE